jgi:hypothetical protein
VAAAVRRAVVVVVVAAAAAGVVKGRSEFMHTLPSINSKASPMKNSLVWSFLSRVVLALAMAVPVAALAATPQETYATPEAAVDALAAAMKADSDAQLLAIFGTEHKDTIIEPDRAVASTNRAKLVEAMKTLRVLEEPSPDRRILVIGDKAWPFPIPIVRVGDRWRFATEQGIEEMANRRIGGNERNAIYVLNAYVAAQRAYASRDRDGDGVLQYAQKVMSSPGKQDGLYWPDDASKGVERSPLGPLIAEATPYTAGHKAGDPYRGYYFRILTQQGKNAPGGAYNYVINGRMIAGFAMIAYPASYGESGVMTFIVNHNGKVYQRDLGNDTAKAAAAIKSFDPAKGWSVVNPE